MDRLAHRAPPLKSAGGQEVRGEVNACLRSRHRFLARPFPGRLPPCPPPTRIHHARPWYGSLTLTMRVGRAGLKQGSAHRSTSTCMAKALAALNPKGQGNRLHLETLQRIALRQVPLLFFGDIFLQTATRHLLPAQELPHKIFSKTLHKCHHFRYTLHTAQARAHQTRGTLPRQDILSTADVRFGGEFCNQ